MTGLILSRLFDRTSWSEARQYSTAYGVKGATSLSIPRVWTPPFALIPAAWVGSVGAGKSISTLVDPMALSEIASLGGDVGQVIVRSSVVGETIWDRGTYESLVVDVAPNAADFASKLDSAARAVLASTVGRASGVMIQSHIRPTSSGEFGNLQRVSKTRDHWEISTREDGGITSRQRLNSQRDHAADPRQALLAKAGLARERFFGSVGAWLNNELLLGHSQRLNCEWISDGLRFYLVQVDEEHEDIWGLNPFQIRVPPAVQPLASSGHFLKIADSFTLKAWDKLEVLEQLWEPEAVHKPTLFYVPISDLPRQATKDALQRLESDFNDLIGEAGIIVRTSVLAGREKLPNLPRTECLTPEAAAKWCFEVAEKLTDSYDIEMAFITHRFVASRASVWARAEPGSPMVELNALWGLPDALQYCPYDIWEVHVPTGVATDYPDYKSDMLVPCADGSWEYVRVKNEIARSNSITSTEAKEVAARSAAVAERLQKPCHIMWFVGCVDQNGTAFNIPWYWTEAHDAERNPDRTSYRVFTVTDRASLQTFAAWPESRSRQALALRPTDLTLMRDNEFIEAVGAAAHSVQVPIVLSGSTLAHAYYQLRKLGCTIVTPSEKEHGRSRRTAYLGKLVRDKIPDKIAARQEDNITRQISGGLRKGFLISKLIEEALEVREASNVDQKIEELADLFEVFRALTAAYDVPLEMVKEAADNKKRRVGGFEKGIILMQTSIRSPDRGVQSDTDRTVGEVLSQKTAQNVAEVPFSFFGFMEIDRPRSIYFGEVGVRIDIILRPDRLEIRVARGPEQLGLPFDS